MIIKTVLTIIASLVLAASCSPGTESNVSEVDDVNRWDSMSTEEKDLFLSTFPSSTAGLSEPERLALLERFDAVVGTPLDRSAESRVEISLEEAMLAQVKEFEALYASNLDIVNSRSAWIDSILEMKRMLDSPFRYYGGEVVTLIPRPALSQEQMLELTYIEAAMKFEYAHTLAEEGVSLLVKRDHGKLHVVIGKKYTRDSHHGVETALIELDPATGAPIQILSW